jgi:hypothetical protein
LPEQHALFEVQMLPSVVQPPPLGRAAHLFEAQFWEQHSPATAHVCPIDLQTPAPHLPPTQLPLQQSVEIVQVAPAVLHVP